MTTNAGGRSDVCGKNWPIFGKSRVTFSVDGLEDTNHLYGVNVDWKRVENSMDVLHKQWQGFGYFLYLNIMNIK